MDPNVQTPTQEVVPPAVPVAPASSVPQQPVQPNISPQLDTPPPSKGNKNMLLIFAFIFVLFLIVITAVLYFMTQFKAQNTQNRKTSTVSLTPTQTPTPTPEINPQDTTDTSLDNDSKVLEQNIENLESDLSSVDSSFSDQQTDLN